MDNARQWQMISTVAVGGFLTAFIVVGCGGGSGGGLSSDFGNNNSSILPTGTGTPRPTPTRTPFGTPRPTPTRTPFGTPRPTPTRTPFGTPRPTPTRTPIGTPKPTPTRTPVGTPKPTPTRTPTGTPRPTPLPTPVPGSLLTTFSVSGSLDASGVFTQDEGSGFYARFRLVPAPTPKPGPTPTPGPVPTPEPGTLYSGTYTLTNGEKGNFFLLAQRDNSASGGGFPTINLENYTLQIATQGTATVALQISGSTGSGSVRLTDQTGATFATGTIKINSKQSFSRATRNFRKSMQLIKR